MSWFHFKESSQQKIHFLLKKHFACVGLEELEVHKRQFPYRVRADLQVAINSIFLNNKEVLNFVGVNKFDSYFGLDFSNLTINDHSPARTTPPEYEEIDIGEDQPIRCLKNGLWLIKKNNIRYAVLMASTQMHGNNVGMSLFVATPKGEEGRSIVEEFFGVVESAIKNARCYRGKILSLEVSDMYSGKSAGIMVQKLKNISRQEIILSDKIMNLLERNFIKFHEQKEKLAQMGQSLKKGVLFYGLPGTGKTFTIHYLSSILKEHTTLIITGEQIGLLSEYMTLARLLQPAIVVIEDVDLIAKDRHLMQSACDESLLNKLLNEMDGLKQDSQVFFILTTNRPETLEAALASRPGRIDQSIEFPLPGQKEREQLILLYSKNINISEKLLIEIVNRTEGTSAAFIKELMRRSVQFALEANVEGSIDISHVKDALDEMLFAGGSLNVKLLGGNSYFNKS